MDLVGISEIAEMLGVTNGRVSQLTHEDNFPKPLDRIKAGPVWKRQTIQRWLERRDNERNA
jgi:predicted DNA-binding transcriptional regulator AlpA